MRGWMRANYFKEYPMETSPTAKGHYVSGTCHYPHDLRRCWVTFPLDHHHALLRRYLTVIFLIERCLVLPERPVPSPRSMEIHSLPFLLALRQPLGTLPLVIPRIHFKCFLLSQLPCPHYPQYPIIDRFLLLLPCLHLLCVLTARGCFLRYLIEW